MKHRLHAAAGTLAFVIIASFWTSTLAAELLLSTEAVAAVKLGVLYGLLALIPAMAVAGSSGFSLAQGWNDPVVGRKKRRMAIVAANGILVMVPAAFYLQAKAADGELDASFAAVQVLELAVGALQLSLLGLNLRDGLRFAGRLPLTPGRIARGRPSV